MDDLNKFFTSLVVLITFFLFMIVLFTTIGILIGIGVLE